MAGFSFIRCLCPKPQLTKIEKITIARLCHIKELILIKKYFSFTKISFILEANANKISHTYVIVQFQVFFISVSDNIQLQINPII